MADFLKINLPVDWFVVVWGIIYCGTADWASSLALPEGTAVGENSVILAAYTAFWLLFVSFC